MTTDLTIRTYIDGINDPYFPSIIDPVQEAIILENEGLILLEDDSKLLAQKIIYIEEFTQVDTYTYTAQRMGAVPSISATIKSYECLDSYWTGRQYIIYNDEKYFCFNTPTSSKKSTDARFEYTATFYSERYDLNGIYFFDVAPDDASYVGGYVSNSTTFSFLGDIFEFAERLQASLDFTDVDYTVVVDEGIVSDPVSVSFENKYILESLQECFNLYDVPYYFKGREIHFGYTDNAITQVFDQGDSLLDITKTNANYKKVTFCSGLGSTENIPYFYPNESDIDVDNNKIPVIIEEDLINTCESLEIPLVTNEKAGVVGYSLSSYKNDGYVFNYTSGSIIDSEKLLVKLGNVELNALSTATFNIGHTILVKNSDITEWKLDLCVGTIIYGLSGLYMGYRIEERVTLSEWDIQNGGSFTVDIDKWESGVLLKGNYDVFILAIPLVDLGQGRCKLGVNINMPAYTIEEAGYTPYVFDIDTVVDYIENILIPRHPVYVDELNALLVRTKENLEKIETVAERMPFTQNLMPTIFRQTESKERFYPAINNTYLIPDDSGDYYYFENEYAGSIIKEQVIQTFDDIKPTIEGILNAQGQEIAKITAFAYDDNDNDDFILDEAGNATTEYEHPYFYIKLKKFDGEHGFNMFASAIDSGEMTINMRSGNLSGTSHIIQSLKEEVVGRFVFHNPVQVDAMGNLVDGDWQDKIKTSISEAQPQQQNTETNEIWIAVTKDIDSFGVIMPNVSYGYYPEAEDRFNITNIFLPQGYITAAEKRLEDAIIQYMWENNTEKFNFTIVFSRVFLAENPHIASQINENARLTIKYDEKIITCYVSSYSYKSPTETESLPEITVTITDTISIQQGVLQNSLTEIKKDILSGSASTADFLKLGLKYFLRKDVEDTAQAPIKFNKGVFSSNFKPGGFAGSGWGIYQTTNGTSIAEFDEILVRRSATFNELIINQISFTLGQTVFSNGGFVITEVEETDDYIRCYYNNEGGQRMAGLIVDDYIRCQEYDPYYNYITRYYSRLVVAVQADYVDLSKTEFDGVGMPQIGDNAVQWGNKTDKDRQYAIIRNVAGGGYDQFLWGINTVNSVGQEYFFVGQMKGQAPRIQFGDEHIGGFRAVLNSNDEGNPHVPFDIWANSLSVISPDGITTQQPNDRGLWSAGTYYANDQVTHNGILWLCTATTDAEPQIGASGWEKRTENSFTSGLNLLNGTAIGAVAETGYDWVKEYPLSQPLKQGREYFFQAELVSGGMPLFFLWEGVWEGSREVFAGESFIADKDYPSSWRLLLHHNTSHEAFAIADKSIMLEEGNSKSAWRLSPDDAIREAVPAEINLLNSSRIDNISKVSSLGINRTLVSSVYGDVVQVTRVSGSGEYQTKHTVSQAESTIGAEVIYYAIIKPLTGAKWYFGGWVSTFAALKSSSQYIELNDGWRLYWTKVTASAAFSTFGLNSSEGSFQVHSFGVGFGNQPPAFWSASRYDLDSQRAIELGYTSYEAMIADIGVNGTIMTIDGKLRANKIDTDHLVAKKMQTDTGNVIINDDEVKVNGEIWAQSVNVVFAPADASFIIDPAKGGMFDVTGHYSTIWTLNAGTADGQVIRLFSLGTTRMFGGEIVPNTGVRIWANDDQGFANYVTQIALITGALGYVELIWIGNNWHITTKEGVDITF